MAYLLLTILARKSVMADNVRINQANDPREGIARFGRRRSNQKQQREAGLIQITEAAAAIRFWPSAACPYIRLMKVGAVGGYPAGHI